jgi:hypothetical protein
MRRSTTAAPSARCRPIRGRPITHAAELAAQAVTDVQCYQLGHRRRASCADPHSPASPPRVPAARVHPVRRRVVHKSGDGSCAGSWILGGVFEPWAQCRPMPWNLERRGEPQAKTPWRPTDLVRNANREMPYTISATARRRTPLREARRHDRARLWCLPHTRVRSV